MATRMRCVVCDDFTANVSPRKWCTECEKEFESVTARVTWPYVNAPCITPYSCCIKKECLSVGGPNALPKEWETR